MENRSNSRIAWVDNVKMIAMLFVMMGHTWRIIHCPLPDWLGDFITSFNMALFVMMTGYTSVGALGRIVDLKTFWTYVWRITKRVLVPAALFYLAFFWLAGPLTPKKLLAALAKIMFVVAVGFIYYKGKTEKRWRIVFDVICLVLAPYAILYTGYWFFAMIWGVCTSMAIGRCLYVYAVKILKQPGWMDQPWLSFIVIALFSVAISLLMNLLHDKTADFLPFFLLGFAGRLLTMSSGIGKIPKLLTIIPALLCLVCGLLLVRLAGNETMDFWEFHLVDAIQGGTLHLFLLRIAASSLVCLFFVLMTRALSNGYSRFSYWGSETMPLYLVHAWIVSVFFYQLRVELVLNDWQYVLYAIPATLLLLVASQGIIFLLGKSAISKALFLGKLEYN